MRTLILKMSMSLDGFVCGPAGEVDWMFSGDPDAIAWSVNIVEHASLHIMGSRTFRDTAGFWPTAAGPFAPAMNRIPKAVFSGQGPAILQAAAAPQTAAGQTSAPPARHPGADSWAEAYVAGGDLADEIARLKAEDGAPILAHGGAGFARSLVARNLVDEYALLVHPIALGRGLPIFSGLPTPQRLEHGASTAFPRGALGQIYRRA